MVHILKLQLMIVQRENMDNIEEIDYMDKLIAHVWELLQDDWARRGKSINELYIIMRRFCRKHDYDL